jgi:prepilin-type N-terminal cleavage/methylation domain-containing protein
MKVKTSYTSGFTLVEIMIVVAVIGLLASIAVPNFVKSRQQAQKIACIKVGRPGAICFGPLRNRLRLILIAASGRFCRRPELRLRLG